MILFLRRIYFLAVAEAKFPPTRVGKRASTLVAPNDTAITRKIEAWAQHHS